MNGTGDPTSISSLLALVEMPGETCVVVELESRLVFHRGEVKSLSAACNDAYGVQYNDPSSAWAYNGETLNSRRQRFENYHAM